MRALPRNLIIILALLLAAAAADHLAMAWSRQLSPIQHVRIQSFPMHFSEWAGINYETELTQAARSFYGSDNFIDRIYSAPQQYPIELVLLPTGAGLHSPKVCARFGGLKLVSEKPARSEDPNDLDRIVLSSPTTSGGELYACGYYWRKLDGVAHDSNLVAPPTHYADSLMVSLCTPMQGSDAATRFSRLDQFRKQVDPEIEALLGIGPRARP